MVARTLFLRAAFRRVRRGPKTSLQQSTPPHGCRPSWSVRGARRIPAAEGLEVLQDAPGVVALTDARRLRLQREPKIKFLRFLRELTRAVPQAGGPFPKREAPAFGQTSSAVFESALKI